MRTLLVSAVLFTAILAGCSSKGGGHDDTFTCPDGKTILNLEDYPDHDNATFNATSKCPKVPGGKGNSTSNSTSRAPNIAPTLMFGAKDALGNATNTTLLNGNLTFSGAGSMDSDGNITGMAMSLTDLNRTWTVPLYDLATKTFLDAVVNFDNAGRVNVSVAVVDDRGGFTTLETKIFVDENQVVKATLGAVAPVNSNTAGSFPACNGPAGSSGALVDNSYFANVGFAVPDDATWIEASWTSGATVYMALCSPDPDGTGPQNPAQISSGRSATAVSTKPDVFLYPAATGANTYNVGVYKTGGTVNDSFLLVKVHYGPRPAA